MNKKNFEQFQGSADYVASEELRKTVNVAIALQRPLLVRGEPGTGKTVLASSIARALDKKLIIWNIKSTTKAQEGLYVYDAVQRLNDSRFGDRDVSDIRFYIKQGKLGEAFTSPEQVVLLIDEIDKADLSLSKCCFVGCFPIPRHILFTQADHIVISIAASAVLEELSHQF